MSHLCFEFFLLSLKGNVKNEMCGVDFFLVIVRAMGENDETKKII